MVVKIECDVNLKIPSYCSTIVLCYKRTGGRKVLHISEIYSYVGCPSFLKALPEHNQDLSSAWFIKHHPPTLRSGWEASSWILQRSSGPIRMTILSSARDVSSRSSPCMYYSAANHAGTADIINPFFVPSLNNLIFKNVWAFSCVRFGETRKYVDIHENIKISAECYKHGAVLWNIYRKSSVESSSRRGCTFVMFLFREMGGGDNLNLLFSYSQSR